MESVSGSVDTFLELTDTPSSYAGAALYFVRVNSGTAALSFGTVDWTDIYSKPSTFAPSAHASSHYAGSADAVGTATPTANAIPYADGSGKLDAWISDAGTAILGKAAFTSGDFTVNGGTVSIDNAHGDARYYTKTEVQTSGSAAIHYNNLTNVPTAGTSTLGVSAFNSGNFTASGGTISIGTIYPRYSGVPTAGAMAYWTGNGTIAAATFGTAPFAQYSGTAGAGALAYYTGTGTITASGTYGTANLVLTSGDQTVAGIKTFSNGIAFGNETLTAYDEGTWTPNVTSSNADFATSYTARSGKYTRIGNVVFYKFFIIIGTISSAGTGDLRVSLPSTVGVDAYGNGYTYNVDFAGTPINVVFTPVAATAYGGFTVLLDNGAASNLAISGIANSDWLGASGFYFV